MPVSNLYQPYLPPRLVKGTHKGADKWYILFYQTDPSTNKRKRFKPTFQMNRIQSKRERLKFAKEKMEEIGKLLPHGYPFTDVTLSDVRLIERRKDVLNELFHTNICEAIDIATKLQLANTTKKKTILMYESRARLFKQYLEKKKLTKIAISEFDEREVQRFLNHLVIEKTLRPRTYNNYLSQSKTMFATLLKHEYIESNPFDGFELKKIKGKLRRDFAVSERQAIAKYLYENDRRLYYAVLIQYYGFIRPAELQRMKFSWFKWSEGIIQIPASASKNDRHRYVTVPDSIRDEIFNKDFLSHPAHFYVFGARLLPHADKQCGANTFNYRHRKALEQLVKRGELHDISGLSFYSWKDTGITEMGEYVSLLDLQRQAGHTNPSVTLKYYHNKRVNKAFKDLEKGIFDE